MPENLADSSQQNLYIQNIAPVVYVLAIQADDLIKIRYIAASADLPQSCDAGLDT